MAHPIEIAVVGAGFSGALVATHLLRRAKAPLTIHLIERNPLQFARGTAYGTNLDCHLLNVPAANMSAFPDDPDHLLSWARKRETELRRFPWIGEISPATFLPRRVYGDYLQAVLAEAERSAAPEVRLERTHDEVMSLAVTPEAVRLRLAGGGLLQAERAVLALGNFPPGNPKVADPSFYRSPRYHGDPWAPGVLTALIETQSCLLIGSGLTMVDWAVSLSQAGYRGKIHVISRRGQWPRAHRLEPPAAFAIDPNNPPPSVRRWLNEIRRYLRSGATDWRPAIDALRPRNQFLWKSLPLPERRRFLRHLRPYWDCHRHRLAPLVAERLDALVASGQLVRHTGRILDFRESATDVEVLFKLRGLERAGAIQVDAVVNCSGSESDYRKLDSPLICELLDRGLIQPDPLALGLATAPDGALIGADGTPSDRLYTLGPPQKGMLWETTAVPEIRGQAARLAEVLLRIKNPLQSQTADSGAPNRPFQSQTPP